MSHEKRNYLCQYLNILDQQTNKHIGSLADLSTEGLMFVSNQIIPINEIKDIYIENDMKDEMQLFIKARIKVLWHKLNINPQMHCIGCKITAIDNNDYAKLETLVKSLSFDPDMEIHRVAISYKEE